jgi:hypothetical protein
LDTPARLWQRLARRRWGRPDRASEAAAPAPGARPAPPKPVQRTGPPRCLHRGRVCRPRPPDGVSPRLGRAARLYRVGAARRRAEVGAAPARAAGPPCPRRRAVAGWPLARRGGHARAGGPRRCSETRHAAPWPRPPAWPGPRAPGCRDRTPPRGCTVSQARAGAPGQVPPGPGPRCRCTPARRGHASTAGSRAAALVWPCRGCARAPLECQPCPSRQCLAACAVPMPCGLAPPPPRDGMAG